MTKNEKPSGSHRNVNARLGKTRRGRDSAEKPVAIYARVSHGDTVALLEQVCRARVLAVRRGWKPMEVIVEVPVSSASQARPGVERLLNLARQRAIEAVITSPTRLARTAPSLHRILKALAKHNVIVVPSEGFEE